MRWPVLFPVDPTLSEDPTVSVLAPFSEDAMVLALLFFSGDLPLSALALFSGDRMVSVMGVLDVSVFRVATQWDFQKKAYWQSLHG
jgi:hypothetical protein